MNAIEIKNVVNRVINGVPKKEYWIQMQIQMEVCDLNECDFLETRFIEYDSYQEFCNDGDSYITSDGKLKGMILMFYENHCPICEAATSCQSFCRSELAIFNEVLGDEVTVERHEHIVEGARRCSYLIR